MLEIPKYRLSLKAFFFNVDHFLSPCGICYTITSVLSFGFLAMEHVGS